MSLIRPEIVNKFTPNQLAFFEHLSTYIDKDLYFYGSITRCDYLPGKSDIDIAIFSDQEQSTIYQISNVLNVKIQDFKKVVYRIDDVVVQGFKLRYADLYKGVETEISVYSDRYKSVVLQDLRRTETMPLYITIILYVVKVLYYDLQIISKKGYKKAKQFLMNQDNQNNFIEL